MLNGVTKLNINGYIYPVSRRVRQLSLFSVKIDNLRTDAPYKFQLSRRVRQLPQFPA
ncbi:MAG: hypothetical protein JGK29_20240 [Microcoleus sp. PH2017_17_BER_D_A]|nr:hypothetical protein [Microcoleus sp. PH2017_17_BER_D_A]